MGSLRLAPKLHSLNLAANKLPASTADALQELIVADGCALTTLRLEGNYLGDAGVKTLSKVRAAEATR